MSRVYKDPPLNYVDVLAYASDDEGTVTEALLQSPVCFFYDACSYRYHANISNPEKIFQFIKKRGGIVVLTHTILMELASGDGVLGAKEICYLAKMKESGVSLFALREETIVHILQECYNDMGRINEILSSAIKDAVPAHSYVRNYIVANVDLYDVLLRGKSSSRTAVGRDFFSGARAAKKEKDNLGETMIAICAYLLAQVPSGNPRTIVLSDDKQAFSNFGKTNERIKGRKGKDGLSVLSTPSLCWHMRLEDESLSIADIQDVLGSISRGGSTIKVLCSEPFEMKAEETSFSVAELAKKIIDGTGFRIYL